MSWRTSLTSTYMEYLDVWVAVEGCCNSCVMSRSFDTEDVKISRGGKFFRATKMSQEPSSLGDVALKSISRAHVTYARIVPRQKILQYVFPEVWKADEPSHKRTSKNVLHVKSCRVKMIHNFFIATDRKYFLMTF